MRSINFYRILRGSISCLLLLHLASAAENTIDPAFSTCGGPCTITVFSCPVAFPGQEYVTLANSGDLASFQASLSSSFAAITGTGTATPTGFEVELTGTPAPAIVPTAENGYTTIPCCAESKLYGYILNAEGTSCGPRNPNTLSLIVNISDYNAAYITVVPTDFILPDSSVLGSHKCVTTTSFFNPVFDIKSKTYYPVLVDAEPISVVPTLTQPSVPETTPEPEQVNTVQPTPDGSEPDQPVPAPVPTSTPETGEDGGSDNGSVNESGNERGVQPTAGEEATSPVPLEVPSEAASDGFQMRIPPKTIFALFVFVGSFISLHLW